MKKVIFAILKTVALTSGIYLSNASAAPTMAESCAADLEEIARFLPINDSGADAARRSRGAAIDAQLQLARKSVLTVTDRTQCDSLLRAYLTTWRPGHLSLGPWPWTMAVNLAPPDGTPAPKADPFAATFMVLSRRTVVLRFPTFHDAYKADIERLLKTHRAALESHPNWIIDVRENNGGSDSTYQPLLAWLASGETVVYNTEWLSTPDNLHAQESLCALAGDPAACDVELRPVIAALRETATGQFTLAKGEQPIAYENMSARKPHRPTHVSVLIDRMCGSSCEQFALAVRESQNVKLLGRPTGGQLDFSNLRPHPLPSGSRAVFYATSRSFRLPDMPIDQIGVQPDILLPRPGDSEAKDREILRVQRWMEGGSLR